MTANSHGLRSTADQTEEQRGGERSILSRQSDDHAELHRQILDYDEATDPASRAEVVRKLCQHALQHAFAQETVLFPAYRQHVPELADELSAHIEGDHKQLDEMLHDLLDADPSASDYDARVRSLFDLLSSDARQEEDVMLPKLQQAVDDAELSRLGDAWEAARAVSPTRAEPDAEPETTSRSPRGATGANSALTPWRRLTQNLDRLPGPTRTLGAGLVAGAAGVAVMTVGEKLEQAVSGRSNSYVPSQTLLSLLGKEPRNSFLVNHLMHWGQGALLGVVRQMMTERGHPGIAASLIFASVRFGTDQTLENATGVGSPPWTWPRDELAMDVAHKIVYAIGTGLVADRLARS